MVSKADHCFHDLILRVRAGEWNAQIAGILSNHQNMRSASEAYELDYLHLPVTKENKRSGKRSKLNGCVVRGWNWYSCPLYAGIKFRVFGSGCLPCH